MRYLNLPALTGLLFLMVTFTACDVQVSTANIGDAWMSADSNGEIKTTIFSEDSIFYAQVDLKNAPPETKVKAVWLTVEVEGEEPDSQIAEYEITTASNLINFKLSLDSLWPVGTYRVDIYLNDKFDRSLKFEVQATPNIEEVE